MLRKKLLLFLLVGLLSIPTSVHALVIYQNLNIDLVRAFPQCAGPGTCSSLPLNEPGVGGCTDVPGVPQPYSFDNGNVTLRVDGSNNLKVKIVLSGVINGDGNTVNSSVSDWKVVAQLRQRGDKEWFAFAGGPLIRENVVNEDVDVELRTFAVQSGSVNSEVTATLNTPSLFDTQEIQVLSVSVLDPAGCIMARGGPEID